MAKAPPKQPSRKATALYGKTTPEKPPSAATASTAGKALPKGNATPKQVKSMAGRIESEMAATKRKAPLKGKR